MRPSTASLFFAIACAGCTSSAAYHPSATQHEAFARQDERAAREHLTSARVTPARSGPCGIHYERETCWTPNDDANRIAAEEHMRAARQHLAAAQVLREAQDRACRGVGEVDRDVSPFAHVKDITRVLPIHEGARLAGAKVTFRRIDDLTPDSLQRIVDCHVAQADALGHAVPEEAFCPLNLPDVKATVTGTPSGYDVAITTDDDEAAREVFRRAQKLLQ
jgi:hypothetical protein